METSNGFGSVGRAFASNINGSQFKARYWQKKLIHKFTVNCWKKKRSWMAHFKRWWNYEMVVVDAIKADNNRPTVLIFKHSDALINFFLIQSERSKPTQFNFLYRFGPRPKARFLKPTSRQCITRILPQSVKQKMENIFSAAPLSHAPKIDCKFFSSGMNDDGHSTDAFGQQKIGWTWSLLGKVKFLLFTKLCSIFD